MALFYNPSLLKLRGTKQINMAATKTVPQFLKRNTINNPMFNPIKWDGARIIKSHPKRATTTVVNMWSSPRISKFLQGSKELNTSIYSFVKLCNTFGMVISFFAWIIKKAVKGRGDGGEIGGKGEAGHEAADKGGTDGYAAGSGVDRNDAAAKGGAASGRGEDGGIGGQTAGGGGQAAGGGGQAAGGGGLRVEFVFSLSAMTICKAFRAQD